jgi:hypothetical protein
MENISLTKENAISILINSVRIGQTKGAFLLKEASLLKKAIDFFNPEVKTKPDFGSSDDPEIVAINVLVQGVQKAQAHGNAYSLDDAAVLWSVLEFLVKEVGSEVASDKKGKGPEKSEDSDDDLDDEIKPKLLKSKK